MTIYLSEIWQLSREQQFDYKCHLAQSSWETDNEEPLDVFCESKSKWLGWQKWRGKQDRFSRQFVFSVMRFYPEGSDSWLFGGIFEIVSRNSSNYGVELTDQLCGFIGRLKLHLRKESPTTTPYLETYFEKFEVVEILREKYAGPKFPGFENINISFRELEILTQQNRVDWQTALGNVSGIYLITDTKTGKRYVGSASGSQGIWSRWNTYADTSDGGNKELQALLQRDSNYARKHFRIALLEYWPARTPNETISKREKFWKSTLLTRTTHRYGLNRN